MKRSQVVHQISDNVLTNFFPEMSLQMKNLIADAIVAEAEKMGMMIVQEPERSEILGWEPEEGWDAFIIEQDKRDQERDFVIPDYDNSRGASIARKFLSGSSFEALAEELNVTQERIRQIVCKNRRLYK